MPQTLTNLITHVVFSTKDRKPLIDNEIKPRLFAYMGGIIRELGGYPLCINGMADHVHLLIRLPPALPLSKALQTVKANSSKWVHQTWPQTTDFAWQPGYGAFTVSRSLVPNVAHYIANQEKHHQSREFCDEFVAFLQAHQIDYDEQLLWS